MRLWELEDELATLQAFAAPKVSLEQYATDAHLAAHIMYTAHQTYDDVKGRTVLDLGCGCGMLSAAAGLLGSAWIWAIDIDPEALERCHENLIDLLGLDNVDLIHADVLQLFQRGSVSFSDQKCLLRARPETVILNPPFGTKNNAGIDIQFLHAAMTLATRAVYSLHKSSTRPYLERKAREWNVEFKVIARMKFAIGKQFAFHRKESVDIEVDLIRLGIK